MIRVFGSKTLMNTFSVLLKIVNQHYRVNDSAETAETKCETIKKTVN